VRAPRTENQLLRLHEEFDLANAAAPELDVVAGHGHKLVPPHRMDLALHRVNVGDRGVVEIFAPDKRRQIFEKTLADRLVARHRSRLDHRRALPVLAERFVIGVGAGQRERDRVGAGIRPQAQVDAQNVAIARALLQQSRQSLGDSHEQLPGFDAWRNRAGARIEQHDEVDVARIVQFARAMLAERQHDKPAAALRIGRLRIDEEPGRRGVLAQQETQSAGDGAVGKAGQSLRHLDEIPHAADIGQRDQQRRLALGEAQRAHQVRLVCIAPPGHVGDDAIQR
jgi:hypothetical protein